MVDTVRSLSAMQALYANNTAGDIGAQDLRDGLVSGWWQYQPATIGDYDDYFTEDNSSDWTTVAPDTGSATWRYGYEARLGVGRGIQAQYSGQNASDWSAYLKSVSGITTGDYVQTAYNMFQMSNQGAVLCFTDGTTTAANFAGVGTYGTQLLGIDGTLTANLGATILEARQWTGAVHLRLTYSAANTFTVGISLNGADFFTHTTSISHTMTPTHAGFAVGAQSVGGISLFKTHYFHSNVTP